MGEHARLVSLPHDDARVLAGDVHVDAVEARDHGCAAADALAAHANRATRLVGHGDVDRVGVREIVGLGVGGEGECEAFGCGPAKRIANAQVVSGKPKHACDKGLVGAVTLVGVRERSKKAKLRLSGRRAAQVSRHKRDAQRACGMRGGRSDHDRADDVAKSKRFHGNALLFLLSLMLTRASRGMRSHCMQRVRSRPWHTRYVQWRTLRR